MNESNLQKEFQEAYDRAHAYWAPYLSEAKTDLSVMLGDQWDATAKNYLERQRRSALVFNKVRRVVKLVEGYQRKNRLALRIDPVEGSDQTTASQLSALCQWQMQACNAYHTMSDAFSAGALKTGINLLNLYVDYSSDPLNGDIQIKRVPYNRFLLDPSFSERDLSDCGYICRRELLSKDAVMALLPASKRHAVDNLSPKGIADGKYEHGALVRGSAGDNLYRYDEFWFRTHVPLTILLDPATGQSLPWKGDSDTLASLLSSHPHLRTLETMKRSVELAVFVEDQLVHHGPETNGLDDYPFVPVLGFFEPEYDQASWKLQGIVRCMRDPQTEMNKRRSKMLDIIDSQISTGWKARENSVVNPESLYQSGQGQVVWMRGEMDEAQRLMPPDIPAGLMQLSEILDRDIMEIPGANSELFGMAESDNMQVAGVLAKMRQAAGLTILQDIFDNYRLAKKLVGQKLVSLIQANYSPNKVARILGQQPSHEFYSRSFGKYDAVPVEGILSDTQRQMYFAQLVSLKQMGAPIPWQAILDAAPIEDKGRLRTMVSAEEQSRANSARTQASLANIQESMARARIQSDLAGAAQKHTQARKNLAAEAGERFRTARDMAQMDHGQLNKVLETAQDMEREDIHATDHRETGQPAFS